MGLLDDAIREHLDLKRRRGADPADIERAEREALGPVRRGPEVAGEGAATTEAVAEPEADHLDSEEQLVDEPRAGESEDWERFPEDPELEEIEEHDEFAPYEAAHSPGGDPLMEDEPFPEAGPQPPSHPADLSEPLEAAPPPTEPPPPHVEQETEEYELEDEPEADDDVLESTPEFLQDAPDHDRLWFEQRPPKDFDFDG
jgi:hypothetical protein